MGDEARVADLVEIEVEVRGETDKAILVYDGKRERWLPLSQVEVNWKGQHRQQAEVTMPMWLAEEKDLI